MFCDALSLHFVIRYSYDVTYDALLLNVVQEPSANEAKREYAAFDLHISRCVSNFWTSTIIQNSCFESKTENHICFNRSWLVFFFRSS